MNFSFPDEVERTLDTVYMVNELLLQLRLNLCKYLVWAYSSLTLEEHTNVIEMSQLVLPFILFGFPVLNDL